MSGYWATRLIRTNLEINKKVKKIDYMYKNIIKNSKGKKLFIMHLFCLTILTKSFKLCLMNPQINNIALELLLLVDTYFMC